MIPAYYNGTNLKGLQKRETYDEGVVEGQAPKLLNAPNREARRAPSPPFASLLRMAADGSQSFEASSVRQATKATLVKQNTQTQEGVEEMAVDQAETAAEASWRCPATA